uniref:MsrB domain-containing protein n=1 Tax=Odontella aurita TaxID=265563 RepID=A0A7S4JRP1_9STRA|mmetsp:Transcript_52560/g.157527  ORF Transcript_52560/g.157527 Transcript_52560/m.157527 type:complete len:250 (+) Transcript_52560:320-1069(+)
MYSGIALALGLGLIICTPKSIWSLVIADSSCSVGASSFSGAVGSRDRYTPINQYDRRRWLQQALTTASISTAVAFPTPSSASAPSKSRTEGYSIQRSEKEWASVLSRPQYNILRLGGTERQRSSILENEERDGKYVCAGCRTPLFESSAKFKSGTGWPSFASALPGSVEILQGEVRCKTCGGHLGDVFNDGWRFLNTPASKTGKRYCIDGAALVFKPDGEDMQEIAGDRPPQNKAIQYEPSMYKEPRKS